LHILGLAETHLIGQAGININGYTWIGNSREHLHVRTRAGSGGVGVLVRNDVLLNYNVIKVNDSVDGILSIRHSERKKTQILASIFVWFIYRRKILHVQSTFMNFWIRLRPIFIQFQMVAHSTYVETGTAGLQIYPIL
jgi:hypothetical protein